MKTLTKILLVASLLVLSSCRPQQGMEATTFNQLIDVPDAVKADYTAKEDEPVLVSYSVDEYEDSIALEVKIVEQPKNGVLKDCKFEAATFKCTYIPNKNFFGLDTFKVTTVDGGLKGDAVALITIKVAGEPDAPSGSGQSEDLIKNNKITFQVNTGTDPDSLASQLKYEVTQEPTNGTLSECFIEVGIRSCSYTPDANYLGEDEIIYKVIDEAGLSSELVTIKLTIGDVFFTATETFKQNEQSEIDGFDLVWVIDNSGSMGDEQDELAANTASFIEKFVNSNIAASDFKMGVTTTEAWYADAETFRKDINGNTYDFSRDSLKANKDLFITNFQAAVKVGLDARRQLNPLKNNQSDQIEKEFAPAERVFQQEAGWYRGNKKALLYIFLTDEPEQSFVKSPEQWWAQFEALKDKANKVKMFPIYRLDNDTQDRFKKTAAHYNVKDYSITSSFDTILNDITLNITKLLGNFSLKSQGRKIIDSSIKVSIGGINIPRVNANGEVQWEVASDSLSFNVEPPANVEIKVDYKYTLEI